MSKVIPTPQMRAEVIAKARQLLPRKRGRMPKSFRASAGKNKHEVKTLLSLYAAAIFLSRVG
eukprot:1665076-Amphidinium_carterae.1